MFTGLDIHLTASIDADNIVVKKNANESLGIDRNSRKLGKYLTRRKWKTRETEKDGTWPSVHRALDRCLKRLERKQVYERAGY